MVPCFLKEVGVAFERMGWGPLANDGIADAQSKIIIFLRLSTLISTLIVMS
jgi:hypothetical protein